MSTRSVATDADGGTTDHAWRRIPAHSPLDGRVQSPALPLSSPGDMSARRWAGDMDAMPRTIPSTRWGRRLTGWGPRQADEAGAQGGRQADREQKRGYGSRRREGGRTLQLGHQGALELATTGWGICRLGLSLVGLETPGSQAIAPLGPGRLENSGVGKTVKRPDVTIQPGPVQQSSPPCLGGIPGLANPARGNSTTHTAPARRTQWRLAVPAAACPWQQAGARQPVGSPLDMGAWHIRLCRSRSSSERMVIRCPSLDAFVFRF